MLVVIIRCLKHYLETGWLDDFLSSLSPPPPAAASHFLWEHHRLRFTYILLHSAMTFNTFASILWLISWVFPRFEIIIINYIFHCWTLNHTNLFSSIQLASYSCISCLISLWWWWWWWWWCLYFNYFYPGKKARAREYLENLMMVERFDMVVMFLGDVDRTGEA